MVSPDTDAAPGLPALDDDGWEDLLNYIEEKRVIPIVGLSFCAWKTTPTASRTRSAG